MGKAFYLNLNLKNYRTTLQTTYKVSLKRLAGFFALIGNLASHRSLKALSGYATSGELVDFTSTINASSGH